MNLVWDTVFTNEYCMDTASTGSIEVQHSLGGGGLCYLLVNDVCGVRYSLRYRIHSGTGAYFRISSQNGCL